jgi:hypothetical protein
MSSLGPSAVSTPSASSRPRGPLERALPQRAVRILAVTLALIGWLVGIVTMGYLASREGLTVGVDLLAYLRAGDALLAGEPVYIGRIGELGTFSYAPPWAVAFAALSWLPDTVVFLGIMAGSFLALRYVAGSWLWAGLVLLYPVSAMVIWAGNIEFYIAAALVLAVRGHAGPLAFTALAKISPILGVPRAGWREAAITLAIAAAITLPWLYLWPEWVEYLLRQPTTIAIHIGPPWYLRLPFALALLLLRRPWAAALAVIVAMPSLWLGTLVLGSAVVRIWMDGRRGSATERAGSSVPIVGVTRTTDAR